MTKHHTLFLETFRAFHNRRELRYPRCPSCNTPLSYTQRLCPAHPEALPEWIVASGRATLHSLVEYCIGYTEAIPPPYYVAMVELEEGPRLVATVLPSDVGPPKVGWALCSEFDSDGRLVFRVPRIPFPNEDTARDSVVPPMSAGDGTSAVGRSEK